MIYLKHQPFSLDSAVIVKKGPGALVLSVPSDVNALVPALAELAEEHNETYVNVEAAIGIKDMIQSMMYNYNQNIIFVEEYN